MPIMLFTVLSSSDLLQYFSCTNYKDIQVWSNMDTKSKTGAESDMRMGTYNYAEAKNKKHCIS